MRRTLCGGRPFGRCLGGLLGVALLAATGCGKYGPPEWPGEPTPAPERTAEPASARTPLPAPPGEAEEEREGER